MTPSHTSPATHWYDYQCVAPMHGCQYVPESSPHSDWHNGEMRNDETIQSETGGGLEGGHVGTRAVLGIWPGHRGEHPNSCYEFHGSFGTRTGPA